MEAQARPAAASSRFVVVFKAERLPADLGARVARAGGKLLKAVDEVGVATVSGTNATSLALARDPSIQSVGRERFYTLPAVTKVEVAAPEAPAVPSGSDLTGPTATDSLYPVQWGIRRVKAPAAWARVPLSVQARATVAVLDTGVLSSHPDLVDRVSFQSTTSYCPEDLNGDGKYDAADRGSALPRYSRWIDLDRPDLSDDNLCTTAPNTVYQAHGTHVAGTVGASFGGGRVVGVAPGMKIAAYKVFDRYTFVDADAKRVDAVGAFDGPIFAAILDAATRRFDVINMSLGGALDRSNKDDNASIVAWDRVVKFANRAGTVVVASAGNVPVSTNGTLFNIPADLPSVLSVSATGVKSLVEDGQGLLVGAPGSDVIAFYSTYGASVNLAAPGGDCGTNPANGLSWCDVGSGNRAKRPADWFYNLILSTVVVEEGANAGKPAYAWYAGTSMASPHVAAVAALVRAQNKGWTPGRVRAHLMATAEAVGSRQLFGQGIVDADAATR